MIDAGQRLADSFRDPAGFVFEREGRICRAVSESFQGEYRRFASSASHARLAAAGDLIPQHETGMEQDTAGQNWLVLEPERIPFISYPYEWCFSQLKDAALLTLRLQQAALEDGFTLRDATPYNVQFLRGRPVHIDALSFATREGDQPWVAYHQFCSQFLAPLALMACHDPGLNRLARVYKDGIPLALASRLLPLGARLWPGLALHLWLHGLAQAKGGQVPVATTAREKRQSKTAALGLVQSLASTVERLRLPKAGGPWAAYYEIDTSQPDYQTTKQAAVADFLREAKPGVVWDLGANTGKFSRLAAEQCERVVAFDGDAWCVERLYVETKASRSTRLLPLVMDLTNASPGLGWQNREKRSWLERGRPDAVMALALIHHLALSHNLPLHMLADFFAELSPWLIVEFVPKNDPNAQRLLFQREDVFPGYTRGEFEQEFARRFESLQSRPLAGGDRRLYLMRRR